MVRVVWLKRERKRERMSYPFRIVDNIENYVPIENSQRFEYVDDPAMSEWIESLIMSVISRSVQNGHSYVKDTIRNALTSFLEDQERYTFEKVFQKLVREMEEKSREQNYDEYIVMVKEKVSEKFGDVEGM